MGEQVGRNSADKGKETGPSGSAATEDEINTIGVNRGESDKKNAACAIFPQEEGTKHQEGASSAAIDGRQTPWGKTDENLLTFSRQKLALLQCEYDPKRCGFCESISAALKQCARCKTAKYCSKECQSTDWEKRHKKDCREIRRLQNTIDKKFSSILKTSLFTVKPSGQPHYLESNMEYSALCFHQGKLLMSGFQPLIESGRLLEVYNPVSFEKERTVTMVEEKFNIAGLCALDIENAQFVAVSIHSILAIDSRPSRIELWAFPIPAKKPIYTFTKRKAMFGPICFSEGKLLIHNENKGILDELDANSIPFSPTGVNISTGIAIPSSLQSMCLITNDNEKQIVLQYLKDDGWEDSRIKCINYEGQELWQLEAPHLDGTPFQPYGICADEEGNIYSAEQESNRVVVIKKDQTIQTLFHAPGSVSCVGWCDQTEKLYVVYAVVRNVQVAIAGYTLTIDK